ncbi:phosphoenolpyruvate carboxylase [Candidatus Peribacteria bacterium]|nr:phosphoenolpyruvate carboxylase [Candidatus Peribacteria bacterium]
MRPSIPVTMATQHPDNACAPWWKEDAFVRTQDEIEEVMILFKELPIDEYMWDWEGKYVDEAVGEKLFSRGQKLFSRRPFGEDLHLTYRIPAFDGEKMHRMARAFMNILALSDLARDIGVKRPPVTEMFLPLTTSAAQPMKVREAFREIAAYHRSVFHKGKKADTDLLKMFDVTPLVEDVPSLLSIDRILSPYWKKLLKECPEAGSRGQRLFLARSDPAMNAGLVPAVLAVKVALSLAKDCADECDMDVFPVLGTGSLPFRGSVNPTYLDTFMPQYAGVRTYSIQSAFRYDYPKEEVRKALRRMQKEVPKYRVIRVSDGDRKSIGKLCKVFTEIWQPTIESIAPLINDIASYMPQRRERLQHIGLFGYSRGIGKVRLPRAIGFTGALYSIGLPPELIATGRGLVKAGEMGLLEMIEQHYPALREDLKHAGKYLNRENLLMLGKKKSVFREIEHDIDAIEKILEIELGPEKPRHMIHRNLTSSIYQRLMNGDSSKEVIQRDLVEAAVIRRSLG